MSNTDIAFPEKESAEQTGELVLAFGRQLDRECLRAFRRPSRPV